MIGALWISLLLLSALRFLALQRPFNASRGRDRGRNLSVWRVANAVLPLFWPVSTALERGLLHFFADKSQNGSSRGGGFGEICAKMTERRRTGGYLIVFVSRFGSWSSRARRIFAAGSQASKTQFCGSFFKAFERVDLVFVCVRQRRR